MQKGHLSEIITQVPEVKQNRPTCPYCQSTKVKIGSTMATAVGGRWLVNGDENDPNHYTSECDCFGCNETFYWEYKAGKQWYSNRKSKILKGVHGCFETAVYTCNKCSSDVKRTYTDLDGVTEVQGLGQGIRDGKWVKFYRTFWKCVGCENGVEVE